MLLISPSYRNSSVKRSVHKAILIESISFFLSFFSSSIFLLSQCLCLCFFVHEQLYKVSKKVQNPKDKQNYQSLIKHDKTKLHPSSFLFFSIPILRAFLLYSFPSRSRQFEGRFFHRSPTSRQKPFAFLFSPRFQLRG